MGIINIIIDEIKDFLQNYLFPMLGPIKFIVSIYITICIMRIMYIIYNYVEHMFITFNN